LFDGWVGDKISKVGKLYNVVTVAGIYWDKSNFLQIVHDYFPYFTGLKKGEAYEKEHGNNRPDD
jgi:hypothetical protein